MELIYRNETSVYILSIETAPAKKFTPTERKANAFIPSFLFGSEINSIP